MMMRAWLWRILKWFFFRLDAETAHQITFSLIRLGKAMPGRPLRIISGSTRLLREGTSAARVFGLEFSSPVGLAAGFDKNAEILEALPDLGFGFAEIGTVTPRSQPGNERPRLFRDPERQALFNRMGFNNLGATIVAERLDRARPRLPASFRVGVNIGKNKDTELAHAAYDYEKAVIPFAGLADYIVINVSSPNTPGLRSLQTVDALKPIVEKVGNQLARWPKRPALLLKLAPELAQDGLREVIEAGKGWGIDGWVLTNTLGGTRNTLAGGWSGAILSEKSSQCLKEARALTDAPIISVGGILSLDEGRRRMEQGASLIQIYSAWIFNGPDFPSRLSSALAGVHGKRLN